MNTKNLKNIIDKSLISKAKQKKLNIISTRMLQYSKEIKEKNGLKTFDKLKRYINKHKDNKFNEMFNLLENDIKMKLYG